MLRVIITDDHPVVLKGLKEIISEGFDDAIIDITSKGYELLSKINDNDYDIVLLDISLPDINGLEVLREIKRRSENSPFLFSVCIPKRTMRPAPIRGARRAISQKEAHRMNSCWRYGRFCPERNM